MKLLGIGRQKDGLYYFDGNQGTDLGFENARFTYNLTKDLWHCRLGHPSDQVMNAFKNDMIAYLSSEWEMSFSTYFSRKPSLNNLRAFGCLCFATILTNNDKFSSRPEKCLLTGIGFAPSDINQDLTHTNFFNEVSYGDPGVPYDENNDNANDLGHLHGSNGSAGEGEMAATSNEHPSLGKYNDYVMTSKVKLGLEEFVNYSNLSPENFCFIIELNKILKPKTFWEASKDQQPVEAMNNEMDAIYKNNTWEITELPKDIKAIGSKWVYKIKYKSSGEIERYKARLIAKGYNHKEGFDFDETFSSVVKIVIVRCFINFEVQNSWPLFKLDINKVFLYGDLSKTVYMSLPNGYFDNNDRRVCKLKKSLYGLKQAPNMTGIALNNRKFFNQNLKKFFCQSSQLYYALVAAGLIVDSCANHHITYTNKYLVNVIDISKLRIKVAHPNRTEALITKVRNMILTEHLTLYDVLVVPKYCVSLMSVHKVAKDKKFLVAFDESHCYALPQDLREMKLLEIELLCPSSLTIDHNEDDLGHLHGSNGSAGEGEIAATSNEHPSLGYQFMHKPIKSHLKIALQVLRYLKGSLGKGVHIVRCPTVSLETFVDADWAKCLVTRNKAAITIAANPVFHERTKHLEINLHFVKEKIRTGVIKT
ncbi:ribonuclease H-like domain-containing protein [Tanacetum coccineum]